VTVLILSEGPMKVVSNTTC